MFKYILLFSNIFLFFSVNSEEVNIYTSRHYESDIQLYEKFTNLTGINVNIISGNSKALEKRIEEEGKDCLADVFIVADAGRLYSATSKKLFQRLNSEVIINIVPRNFRTSYWFGIAKRARIIFIHKNNVNKNDIKKISYEDLANPEWNQNVLIRSSNNIYNQSLVAALIENIGHKKTKEWTTNLVNNFARSPKGNDRSQMLGVASGEAEIAVANTYYYALMLSGKKGDEQKEAAKNLVPVFPNQSNRGTHMNISGAGLLKYSKNKDNAIRFLEFLLSKEAQEHIVNNTFEYPMINNVQPHKLIASMGLTFKQDDTDVSSYGKWQSDALKIMIESGWR